MKEIWEVMYDNGDRYKIETIRNHPNSVEKSSRYEKNYSLNNKKIIIFNDEIYNVSISEQFELYDYNVQYHFGKDGRIDIIKTINCQCGIDDTISYNEMSKNGVIFNSTFTTPSVTVSTRSYEDVKYLQFYIRTDARKNYSIQVDSHSVLNYILNSGWVFQKSLLHEYLGEDCKELEYGFKTLLSAMGKKHLYGQLCKIYETQK